ncbi:MAG: hypothetical protein IKP26_02445 [Clostridia bacterium]|nr:hypothetical protein [Clostridia bacterium]
MNRAIAGMLALIMLLALASCAPAEEPSPEATPAPTAAPLPEPVNKEAPDALSGTPYTYYDYFTEFPASWSPHALLSDEAERIAGLISSPLVSLRPADTETGGYVWAYEMAESIEDITAESRDDIVKYGCSTGSKRPSEMTEGLVFRVRLRDGACWETGERITADDYVDSLKALLDPALANPAAARLCMDEAAPAGAEEYYKPAEEWEYVPVGRAGYASNAQAIAAGETLMLDMWSFWGLGDAVDKSGAGCPNWVEIGDRTEYQSVSMPAGEPMSAAAIWAGYAEALEVGSSEADCCAVRRRANAQPPDFASSVGCYKADELTFIYVCGAPVSMDALFNAFSRSWLVYMPLYEKAADHGYCTALNNTPGFGPYKLSSCVPGERITLTRNPLWYGWKTNDDGSPIAFTEQLLDGEHVEMFRTTRVIFTRMSYEEARQAYSDGRLTEWRPNADDTLKLASNERLFITPGTGMLRLIFNSNETLLKNIKDSRANRNSFVLTNYSFRRAISLSIDRVAVCSALGGSPSVGLIGGACYVDAFGDPASDYRSTPAAMQAMCELYGVEYGAGTFFDALEDAYASISGYDAELAHELFVNAADELISGGMYRAGEPIRVRVACTSGALTEADTKLIELLNGFVNEALSGTAFGSIEFEAVGHVVNLAEAVSSGRYPMGIDRNEVSAFCPFTALMRDCGSGYCPVPCAGCFEPSREPLELNVNGAEVTMTWLDWSRSMTGAGRFAAEDNETRLSILAALEKAFLDRCFCIPLLSDNESVMLSEKAQYLTPELSPLWGRGGFRFMGYNYSDAEWEARDKAEVG